MFKHMRDPDNLVVPVRALRSNTKRKPKLQRPTGQLHRDSPLYRGSLEWDKLDAADQTIASYERFMNKLKN